MKKLHLYCSCVLLGFAGCASADGEVIVMDQNPVTSFPKSQQKVIICPPIHVLVKNPEARTWSAPHGWKSYEMSFVDKITQFSGAQWRGTNVGQIFCVYRGESPTSFPVLLAYNVLAFAPEGGKWSKNLGGYENCETDNTADCAFIIRIKPENEDLYEQAEHLKKNAPLPSSPGF